MAKNNKVIAKKMELEVLGDILEKLDSIEKDTLCNYERIGERQAKTWRGELLWEDEEKTVPQMESVWDYVPIPKDQLDDDQKAKAQAIISIRATLEKMI